MTAQAILNTIQATGATVVADGALIWVTPSNVLTDDLRAAIKANKADLLQMLTTTNGYPLEIDVGAAWRNHPELHGVPMDEIPPAMQELGEGLDLDSQGRWINC